MMTQSLNPPTVTDYARSIEEVARSLQMDLKQGLTTAEIDKRLQRYGLNELKTKPGKPAWLRFLLQFNQALLYILFIAGAIKAFLGSWTNAAVIWGVTVINAVIGLTSCLRLPP